MDERNTFAQAGLATALRREEAALRLLTYEEGVFLDADGNVILRRTVVPDKPFEIEYPEEDIARVVAVGDATFTHNHPRGWQYPEDSPLRAGHSFSLHDMQLACRAELIEIRAITPLYVYSMKPASLHFEQAEFPVIETLFQTEYAEIYRRLVIETAQNLRTMDEALAELEHLT